MSSKYVELYDRATAVRNAIVERARQLGEQAGFGRDMPFLMAHNAMCAADAGKPWRGTDYRLVRRILWLEQRSFLPHRILSRWCGKNPVARIRSAA